MNVHDRVNMKKMHFRKSGGGHRKRAKMENLSDDLLIESYVKAMKYHLSSEFIQLIEQEVERRKLTKRLHQMNGGAGSRQ